MFKTPVLFLIFNRLETTKLVFEEIKIRQPEFLFIAADGPRSDKIGEKEITDSIRKYVIDQIDWPCEVKTLFREVNLGCGKAVSEAITWFFDSVEEGIILEDDCLVDPSFFVFCEEMLYYNKNDPKIFHISGNNFQQQDKVYSYSYYYSRYPHCWGWATWRRAWKEYDFQLEKFNYKKKLKNSHFYKSELQWFYDSINIILKGGYSHSWDFQWQLCLEVNNAMAIIPEKNLVKNIGFGKDATHTFSDTNSFIDRERNSIGFPLIHNPNKNVDIDNDKYLYFSTTYKWRNKGHLLKLFLSLKYYFNRIKKLFLF